jgi:hypothetical protein
MQGGDKPGAYFNKKYRHDAKESINIIVKDI